MGQRQTKRVPSAVLEPKRTMKKPESLENVVIPFKKGKLLVNSPVGKKVSSAEVEIKSTAEKMYYVSFYYIMINNDQTGNVPSGSVKSEDNVFASPANEKSRPAAGLFSDVGLEMIDDKSSVLQNREQVLEKIKVLEKTLKSERVDLASRLRAAQDKKEKIETNYQSKFTALKKKSETDNSYGPSLDEAKQMETSQLKSDLEMNVRQRVCFCAACAAAAANKPNKR